MCTPDVAERQDWLMIQAIFDYRNAKLAVELFNSGERGAKVIEENAALGHILVEMHRAQQPGLTLEDVLRDMKSRKDPDGDSA